MLPSTPRAPPEAVAPTAQTVSWTPLARAVQVRDGVGVP